MSHWVISIDIPPDAKVCIPDLFMEIVQMCPTSTISLKLEEN